MMQFKFTPNDACEKLFSPKGPAFGDSYTEAVIKCIGFDNFKHYVFFQNPFLKGSTTGLIWITDPNGPGVVVIGQIDILQDVVSL